MPDTRNYQKDREEIEALKLWALSDRSTPPPEVMKPWLQDFLPPFVHEAYAQWVSENIGWPRIGHITVQSIAKIIQDHKEEKNNE